MTRRRHLIALLATTALAACGVVTTNGSTVTVNVAQAVAYSSGISALVNAFLGFPGVTKALGSALLAVQAAIADIGAVGPAVQAAAGNSQSFSFDKSSPPAFLSSLTADVGTLRTDVAAAMGALGSSGSGQVTTYYQAILTVLSAISVLFALNSATTAAAAPGGMSVKDALALVHVQAP